MEKYHRVSLIANCLYSFLYHHSKSMGLGFFIDSEGAHKVLSGLRTVIAATYILILLAWGILRFCGVLRRELGRYLDATVTIFRFATFAMAVLIASLSAIDWAFFSV